MERQRAVANRAIVRDRLIGRRITVDAWVAAPDPGGRHRPVLLWLLDVDRCPACFDSVVGWMDLERLADHDLLLILVGEVTPDVQARLRLLRRTTWTQATESAVQSVVGPVLPNTRMLLDSTGIAMLVDSRSSGQECGWSFEAQVGALLRLNPAARIRS